MSKLQHQYHWQGINPKGIKCNGTLSADSKHNAIKTLKHKRIFILQVKKIRSKKLFFYSHYLTDKQRLDLTQALYWLIQTGIPLVDALILMSNSYKNAKIKQMLLTISTKLSEGNSFFSALSNHPKSFPLQYRKLIHAGEQAGCLESMLKHLINYQEQLNNLKSKITKALIYPISIVIITILMTIGLLTFVIPQFQHIYQSFNAKLPTLTLTLISISNKIIYHPTITLAFPMIILITLVTAVKKTRRGKNLFFKLLLTIPFFRQLIILTNVAKWSQTLATTLNSGIQLIDALHISNQAIANLYFQREMTTIEHQIMTGVSLKHATDSSTLLPTRVKQLIAIGENTDALLPIMQKIAMLYLQTMNDSLDRLSKLVEPVIMITVAMGISGIIIAMYLPIFRMGNII